MAHPLTAPVDDFDGRRVNRTLHGRSVYRNENVTGHNVFKGWSTWKSNGHRGVGDGLDVYGLGWDTPVVAVCDGRITSWRNDTSKLEVVYLEAPGVVAVYAHIDYRPKPERFPRAVSRGEMLGVMRGDLNDPHLHFELWLDGKALAAPTATQLRELMSVRFTEAPTPPVHWAQADLDWAVEEGIMEDGSRPDVPATRAEVVAMIRRATERTD